LLLGFHGKAEAISIFEPPDFSSVLATPTDLGSFDDPDYPANIGGTLDGDSSPQDFIDVVKYRHIGTDGLLEITFIVSSFAPHPFGACLSYFVDVGSGASTKGGCPSAVGSETFSMFVNSGDEVQLSIRINGQITGTSGTYEFEITHSPSTQTIGGQIIPIETTSLILAGAQTFSWMIPVVLSVVGITLFVVSRKSENS